MKLKRKLCSGREKHPKSNNENLDTEKRTEEKNISSILNKYYAVSIVQKQLINDSNVLQTNWNLQQYHLSKRLQRQINQEKQNQIHQLSSYFFFLTTMNH